MFYLFQMFLYKLIKFRFFYIYLVCYLNLLFESLHKHHLYFFYKNNKYFFYYQLLLNYYYCYLIELILYRGIEFLFFPIQMRLSLKILKFYEKGMFGQKDSLHVRSGYKTFEYKGGVGRNSRGEEVVKIKKMSVPRKDLKDFDDDDLVNGVFTNYDSL